MKQANEIIDRINQSFLSKEIIEAYSEGMGYPVSIKLIEDAEEAYSGSYESNREFAEAYVSENELAESIPDWLFDCLDFEAVWLELRHDFFCVQKNGKKIFFRHL